MGLRSKLIAINRQIFKVKIILTIILLAVINIC